MRRAFPTSPSVNAVGCMVAAWCAKRFASVTPSTPFVDHYDRLHIHAEATPAEIKQAYRKRALECHPDVVAPESKAAAEAEFRKVSESYEFLSDAAQRKAYDKEHQKKVPPNKRRFKKPVATQTAPSAAVAPTDSTHSKRPMPAREAAKRQQKANAAAFVRRDADRVFKDAFDGMSLDDVMFQVRKRERARRKQGRSGAATSSDASSTTPKQESPAGHDEVMSRILGDAAKRFADRVAQAYGHEALKGAKFVRMQPPKTDAPPSNQLPFRPFIGMKLPEGVEAPEVPRMGAASHIADEPVEALVAPLRSRLRMPVGTTDVKTRATVLKRLARDTQAGPHNQGQIYSYHRAY